MTYPISPCKAQCKLDENDICAGCHRTIDEIVNWANYTNEQKIAVFERLETQSRPD